MNNNLSSLLIVSLSLIIWYLMGLGLSIKRKGLDPTLVTLINLFYLFKFKTIKWVNLLVLFAVIFVPSWMSYMSYTLVLFSLIQIILLGLFERVGTQPIILYLLIFLEGAFLAFRNVIDLRVFLIMLVVIMIVEQVVILRWPKNRIDTYNNWVAKKVLKLNKKYGNANPNLTKNELLYTLHFAVTESIARPAIVRLGERIYFYLKRPKSITSGIMQVKSNKLLSNQESVLRGSKIIAKILSQLPSHLTQENKYKILAKEYNGSIDDKANQDYVGYLLSTRPGVVIAWDKITSGDL